ncbi:MAG TPA: glycosyltransferase [Thermoanaerobaculia bacterium]|jgi:dolichol-phosphate mannosyltransferase|nr:glycosyltransferase [Thermoanaerobaculia bacterium]
MNLAVVVAAYNEQENIEALTRRLVAVLRGMHGCNPELIYVVEGDDGTKEIVERLSVEFPAVRLLYQTDPTGLANAFRRGFAAVSLETNFVVTMDADLNHQPEEIPRLLARAVETRADIIVGSRFVRGARVDGVPVWKIAVSRLVNRAIGLLFGLRIQDKTSGFRVYRSEALRAVEFTNSGFAFLPEILIDATASGLEIVEEPIHFVYRIRGTSKMNLWRTSGSYIAMLRRRLRAKSARR